MPIKKVLIVDDDAGLINMLRDYLPQVMKIELFVSVTGEEALKVLETKKPDAVLLDMQLPGIKGPEILRIIRDKYPKTKVLVVTSYDKEVKEEVSKLGVDGFFPKPIVLNEVISRIEGVLKAKEATLIEPIALADIRKKEGVIPKAKIMFIEREFFMPYLLPIAESGEKDFAIEGYGEYEFHCIYCQKEAIPALNFFKPDVVICATDVPEDAPFGHKSVSMVNTIIKIMKSKNAPKAVIVHGAQQSITSSGVASAGVDSTVWIEKDDMYNYDPNQDRENVERLNKMLWSICFKHNLVKEVK
jgi:DNA-binding NarL/FixJ family response regulator